jgi:hypothetical protein
MNYRESAVSPYFECSFAVCIYDFKAFWFQLKTEFAGRLYLILFFRGAKIVSQLHQTGFT